MKGQNIGGKKSLQFHIHPVQIQTLLAENGELNWIIQNNKVQTILKKDLLTALLFKNLSGSI